jgi:hypothetical protein
MVLAGGAAGFLLTSALGAALLIDTTAAGFGSRGARGDGGEAGLGGGVGSGGGLGLLSFLRALDDVSPFAAVGSAFALFEDCFLTGLDAGDGTHKRCGVASMQHLQRCTHKDSAQQTHTHTHTRTHARTHRRAHTQLHTHLRTHTHAHIYTHTFTRTHTHSLTHQQSQHLRRRRAAQGETQCCLSEHPITFTIHSQ